MITRRKLLMGLAGGVAAATAAVTLVRASSGLTPADLPLNLSDIGFYGSTPVSTPRYVFKQDMDTGIYRAADDTLQLVAGGVRIT